MDFQKDYYKILSVDRQATPAVIKAAYRKLAKRYHPDLNPDDSEAEEKIKLLNEAWAVLSDPEQRFVYDTYRDQLSAEPEEMQDKTNPECPPFSGDALKEKPKGFKRRTTRKDKIYLRGEIKIKYRGKQDDELTTAVLQEVFYRLQLTTVLATIVANDICRGDLPDAFNRAYHTKHLRIPVPQPVPCFLVGPDIERYYRLQLEDLILTDVQLIDVIKDDGDSFGTITGQFFAYVPDWVPHEEWVEEQLVFEGKTGQYEQRRQKGAPEVRHQYFHANGDTYWGNWIQHSGGYQPLQKKAAQAGGCLPGIVRLANYGLMLIMLVLILPFLWGLWPLWIFCFVFWLLSRLHTVRGAFRVVTITFMALLVWAVFNELRSDGNGRERRKAYRWHKQKDFIKQVGADTLITRFRQWRDYRGRQYEGYYTVSSRDWRKAHQDKENLQVNNSDPLVYAHILSHLSIDNVQRLGSLYGMLDDIRAHQRLGQSAFAEMFVSMIQNMPYAMVLPKACDANLYDDHTVAAYLGRPDARCDPDQRFGINTPVEFLASLNGDCDSRTLLIFTVLKHYGYHVAILSSTRYSHSLLGIELPYDGTVYVSSGHRYVLWETTTPVPPGLLAPQIANLDHWNITLTSK